MGHRRMGLFTRPVCLLVVIIGAAVLLSACYRQLVSEAYLTDDRTWSRDGWGIFHGPGIEMEIRVSNETVRSWFRGSMKDSLGLSVQLHPLAPGLTFDPHDTQIVLSDTGAVTPSRIEAIADASFKTGVHEWRCWSNRRQQIKGEPPYTIQPGACFEFYFPIPPPSPDTSFSLRLRGLSRDGKRVEIPEVHFKEGSFWVFDFLGK